MLVMRPAYLIALSAGLVLAGAMATAGPASACGAGSPGRVQPDGSIVYRRCGGYHPHRPAVGGLDTSVRQRAIAPDGRATRQARVQRHDHGRRVRAHQR